MTETLFSAFWPTHRGSVDGGLRRCGRCGMEHVDEQFPTFSANAQTRGGATLLQARSAWWYALDADVLGVLLDEAGCTLLGLTGHIVVEGLPFPSWSALWPLDVVRLAGDLCAECGHVNPHCRGDQTFGALAGLEVDRLERWVRDRSFAWVGERDAALAVVSRRTGDRLARLVEDSGAGLAVCHANLSKRQGAKESVLWLTSASGHVAPAPWLL